MRFDRRRQRSEIGRRKAVASGLLAHADYRSADGAPHIWLTLPDPWRSATFTQASVARDVTIGTAAEFMVDQVAAAGMGSITRLPSLEIGAEPGRQAGKCDSGYSCAYSNNISWRNDSTAMAKEINPRAVFERLFGGGSDREKAEGAARRRRQSVRRPTVCRRGNPRILA